MDAISEPVIEGGEAVMPPTHSRILKIMAILGVLGSVVGSVFVSLAFGIGILLGVGLSFGNYYWLRYSLRKVFAEAVEGEKPRLSVLRYITRYLAIAAVIALIYVTGVLPIVAVILGLCAFAFAVVIDGMIRIFRERPDTEVN
jgi:energy-converting hydrogenase Eha subunit A